MSCQADRFLREMRRPAKRAVGWVGLLAGYDLSGLLPGSLRIWQRRRRPAIIV